MMLHGACHCGAVQIEVDSKPESISKCTCSICHRYGARWAYYTRQSARILDSEEVLRKYLWGDKTIEFYHCGTCGCITHYESVEKTDDGRIAVNTRMMQQADIDSVPVRTFDGAVTWKYLDE